MEHKTILGIDPGTKEMGLVVLCGRELLAYGVHTLRNGNRPHDVIGQARRVVLAAIERHQPDAVAIEEPLMLPTKRAAVMSVIEQELQGRAEELGLKVVELSPMAVRAVVAGNPRATKRDIAEKLVQEGFQQLRELIPKRPQRVALGLRPKDKYWLHMFDALALAVAAGKHMNESPSWALRANDRNRGPSKAMY
jgi:Holliday junction resolvasome RuvABC endonuclease subunit